MCVCVRERDRQTQRKCGRRSIKTCRSTGWRAWLGNSFYCRNNFFFFFLLRQLRDIIVRKVESKSSSWDEPAYRGTADTGGRLGKHVRVLNLSGRHSWSGMWGRFPWWGHKAGGTNLDTGRGDGGALRLLQPHPVLFKASLYYFLTK